MKDCQGIDRMWGDWPAGRPRWNTDVKANLAEMSSHAKFKPLFQEEITNQ